MSNAKQGLFNQHSIKQNPQILKEFNIIAITELYEGIKFKCSNCGMRFIRNEHLKAHLDKHFMENNEIRKQRKYNPNGGPLKNRPLFNSFQDWIQQGSQNVNSSSLAQSGAGKIDPKIKLPAGGVQASGLMAQGTQNIVPFSAGMDSNCFMCKEKLRIEKDDVNNQLTGGDADENCYFIEAKKIRVSIKNKISGQIDKKEVTVHSECMKQLEDLKMKREAAKGKEETTNIVLGKRGASGFTGQVQKSQNDPLKRQRMDEPGVQKEM